MVDLCTLRTEKLENVTFFPCNSACFSTRRCWLFLSLRVEVERAMSLFVQTEVNAPGCLLLLMPNNNTVSNVYVK